MRSWTGERMDRSQLIASAAGLDRRSLLRLSAGSLGGVCAGWSSILNASPTGRSNSGHSKARSVIMIFNCGAPSHHDLWDPKPQAPDDVRGIFSTIDTNVPGIHVSELIPDLAKRADKLEIGRAHV